MDIGSIRLLVIFPCYNEEEVLKTIINRFFSYFEGLINRKAIAKNSRICFVDDGSKDKTWREINDLKSEYVYGIKLTNNFGHQKALLAGMDTFKNEFDAYVTLDVDLQDDFTVLEEMLEKLHGGTDIVYGVRNDRTTDSPLKRKTAGLFYNIMEKMGVKTIHNHADFRLINNKALHALLTFPESHLFLRAIFPVIGLNHDVVYYKRQSRDVGESKYPIRKMISFAWEGITSFSATPLRLVLVVGLISILISIGLLVWATIVLLLGKGVTGWFSMITVIIFFGGVQTFAIGIIGEYVGKIYVQSKNRPRYLIDTVYKKDEGNQN